MENSINITISPLQAVLSFAFQVWIIVFPIILIRKLNYLTALLTDQRFDEDENGEGEGS